MTKIHWSWQGIKKNNKKTKKQKTITYFIFSHFQQQLISKMTATGIEPTTTWLTVRLQTFWYRACFKQGVPWHSANYRVQIHSKRACDVLKRHSLLMGQFWLEIAKKKFFWVTLVYFERFLTHSAKFSLFLK